MSNKIIKELRRYASHGIHELTKQDRLLVPIDELVQRDVADPEDVSNPINDEKARRLIKWSSEDDIETPFDGRVVQSYRHIGEKVLEVACDLDSNNDNLMKVAMYLHPLLSQDDRTVDMGWDLEEYMDWYFLDTTQEEREQYAKELVEGWYIQ